MSENKASGVTAFCLCVLLLVAGAAFVFRGPPSAKHGLKGGLRTGLASATANGSPTGFPPEGAPDLPGQRMKSANLLAGVLKGRENNFIGEIRDWARQDPEAALAWAQHQPANGEARREALTDACFQIARTDSQRAVVLAEQFRLDREAVLTNLTQQWATKDLASASEWIGQQTDDDQRNALTTGLTLVWSKSDPAGAADFVAQRMTPGSERDSAVVMVVHQWALSDPTGAAAWVRQFPESPLRTTAMGELENMAQHTP